MLGYLTYLSENDHILVIYLTKLYLQKEWNMKYKCIKLIKMNNRFV